MNREPSHRRILLLGTDGLRPDCLDPEIMPTYAALLKRGTRLRAHHSVFPSITRAIISSINTGCTPGKHGLTSGTMRVDNATDNHIVETGEADQLAALDRLTGGMAIMQPTLADLLEPAGITMAVAGAQTTGGGAVWARKQTFPMVNTSTTYGRDDLQALRDRLGGPPPPNEPLHRNPQVEYVARAVSELFLDDEEIRLIAVWFAEPDASLHKFGLGSPEVRHAMGVCDRSLAVILDGMDRRGIRDDFDIMLISDHGHSTVAPQGNLDGILARAREELGEAMPAVTHTSNNIYAMPNQPAPSADALAPLVAWLQRQPWVGALFGGTDDISDLPGMLSLKNAWNGVYGDRAPLIAISSAWTDDLNAHGVPGTMMLPVNASRPLFSSHGTASPYDMHAFAAFIGPDFLVDADSEIPSGATDIAPTILHLLGQDVPGSMDGRVLTETFRTTDAARPTVETSSVQPATPHPDGFAPTLTLKRVGTTTYIDQATNGLAIS